MKNKRKITKFTGAILLFLLPLVSCSKETEKEEIVEEVPAEETPPQLKTVEVKNITTTGAVVVGQVVDRGTASITERGVAFSSSGTASINGNTVKSSKVSGSGLFEVELSGLENNTDYNLRAYALTHQGTVFYGEEMKFKTVAANLPKMKTSSNTVAGAHMAFVNAELTEEGGADITEKGIVWSENEEPSVEDNKIISKEEDYKFKTRIEGLDPDSQYYVRSYAINSEGVGYGDQVVVNTIPKGNVTYYLNKEDNPSEELQEIYDRIEDAFDVATEYYDNFTPIVKHLNVSYNPGVATADGHINGTIRIGPNVSYQRAGTAMHEIMHTVGVGQHWRWGEMISGGTWSGTRANEILQMMTDSPDAVVKGDGHHFWPYGINGAHEDTEDEMLYIMHALIVQGFNADGLPSSN